MNPNKGYREIDGDAINDKQRTMNSLKKKLRCKLMLIDKGIVLGGWIYNSDFLLKVYIHGDIFCQGMHFKEWNDQLY